MTSIIPCSFCIDSEKNCNHHCKGTHCKNNAVCHRKLKAIVRITMKCTQECHHCCFACSPKKTAMMTINTAKLINQFMIQHQITQINIMGGEFFCNPEWNSIIQILCNQMHSIRLTTNGDWGNSNIIQSIILKLCNQFPITIAISKDHFHTNQYIDKAYNFCIENKLSVSLGEGEVDNEESIVPIKKGYFHSEFMASISKYCGNPNHRYSFMIDEKGNIYKCPMGIWNYDNIESYLETNPIEFFNRFKQIYNAFKCVIACNDCNRIYNKIGTEFEER